jgi:hypothetical protein
MCELAFFSHLAALRRIVMSADHSFVFVVDRLNVYLRLTYIDREIHFD